ncbi:MAG TPA: type II secretion system F family protein [bacterium]|jgi:type IV pilus assembly protein PilC|nr:type II secretion system F family protein [bacterium]
MAAPAKTKTGGPPKAVRKGPKTGFALLNEKFERMNEKMPAVSDVAIFSRQFSTMINAGLPVLQCLSIIAEQQSKLGFKRIINELKDEIGSGGNLSDGLAKHPKVFNELYVNMVRAGELGGVLDTILDRLSIYMEKAEALRRKIKGAMMYPTIVVSVALLVVAFLMVKVIPTFQTVFATFGHGLPPLTQFVVNISDFMQHEWYVILIALGVLFATFKLVASTSKGAYIIDGILLKLPIFGDLLRKSAVAKFARTLSTLLKSGVPILEAMETVAKTSGNKRVEEVINGARASIREGQGMVEPLKKGNIFPPMVIQMVGVGEETGKIDEMLMRTANFFEEEVDTAVEGLSAAMEPLIIVFLGLVLGVIIVAMFLPIFSLGEVVSS